MRAPRSIWVAPLVALILCATTALAGAAPGSPAGTTFSATAGTPVTAVVATFSSNSKSAIASEWTATIAWGDGTSSAGQVEVACGDCDPPTLRVRGTHTYAAACTCQVTVTIRQVSDNSTGVAHSTANVSGPPAGPSGPGPAPGPTAPKITTLSFASLPAGDPVTTQFRDLGGPGQGITFGKGPPGYLPTTMFVTDTPSGKVAQASDGCSTKAAGQFGFVRPGVTLHLGAFSSGLNGSVPITVSGFDAAGAMVAKSTVDVPADGSFDHGISLSDATGAGITSFTIEAPALRCFRIGIKDVAWLISGPKPPPAFALAWKEPASGATLLAVPRGKTGIASIAVTRINGSSGPLDFHAEGLPAGVSASFAPDPVYPDDVRMTVAVAGATILLGDVGTITVTATGPPSAGPGTAATIPLRVIVGYDVQVQGIDFNQGVQSQFAVPGPQGLTPPYHQTYAVGPAPIYTGAIPIAGADTVARVYAHLKTGPDEGVPDIPALLYGFSADNGEPLPGSPLLPQEGPRLMTLDLSNVTPLHFLYMDRSDPNGAYTFALPASWTEMGTLKLRAEVNPPTLSGEASNIFAPPPTRSECAACRIDNTYELTGIAFDALDFIEIRTHVMTHGATTAATYDPVAVLDPAIRLSPHGAGQTYVSPGAPVDISAVAACKTLGQCAPDLFDDPIINSIPGYPKPGDPVTGAMLDALALDVLQLADDGYGDIVMGIEDLGNGLTRGKLATPHSPCLGCVPAPFTVVQPNRPLTSVAHELHHALGRAHASAAGGGAANGEAAEQWPPDGAGYGDGYGYGFGLQLNGGPVTAVNALGSTAAPFYDFMSYAASSYPDADSWQSVRGWNSEAGYLKAWDAGEHPPYAQSSPLISAARRRPAIRTDRIKIHGFFVGGATVISGVSRATGRSEPVPAASDFHVALLAQDGTTIADSPLNVQTGHVDDHPPTPVTFLSGELPASTTRAAGAPAAVEVRFRGRVLARKSRSAHAPTVRLLAPRPHARLGGRRSTVVRWKAGDADGGQLVAIVQYSADGGRNWHTVAAGPSRGRARVAARLFGASRPGRARVRVVVNDGFNERIAGSGPLTSRGAAPLVHIGSPRAGARVRGDAVTLSGQAVDDHGVSVRAKRLTWYVGHRRLGRGRVITVSGLPGGRRTIRLVAVDVRGRRGVTTRRVRIKGVAPRLLTARVVRRLRRSSHTLRLRVSTTERGKLSAAGRRFRVSRKPHTLSIPVHVPKRGKLKLTIRLSAGGTATREKLRLPVR